MRKLILISVFLSGLLMAQNSFYSSYGFGMKSPTEPVRSISLGFTGLAMPDSIGLNTLNPALWKGFLTTSVQGQLNSQYLQNSDSDFSGSLTRFMGFSFKMPIGRKAGFALGMRPVTRMESERSYDGRYEYADTSYRYLSTRFAIGGISELYTGFGFQVHRQLSLGVAGRFHFGNLVAVHDIDLLADGDIDVSQELRNNLQGVTGVFGAVLRDKSGRNRLALTLNQNLEFNYDKQYLFQYGSDSTTAKISLKYPSTYAIGFMRQVSSQLRLTADFQYTSISSSLFEDFYLFEPVETRNSYAFGMGLERTPTHKKSKLWANNIFYRAGVYHRTEPFYSDAFLSETGLSIGFGIPFGGMTNRLDIALLAAYRSGFADTYGDEKLLSMSIGVTTGDIWFRQIRRR